MNHLMTPGIICGCWAAACEFDIVKQGACCITSRSARVREEYLRTIGDDGNLSAHFLSFSSLVALY